jgi:hypothetical protein
MVLVLLPLHKFICPPYCYYWLQEVKKDDVWVTSSGIHISFHENRSAGSKVEMDALLKNAVNS